MSFRNLLEICSSLEKEETKRFPLFHLMILPRTLSSVIICIVYLAKILFKRLVILIIGHSTFTLSARHCHSDVWFGLSVTLSSGLESNNEFAKWEAKKLIQHSETFCEENVSSKMEQISKPLVCYFFLNSSLIASEIPRHVYY